MGSSSGWLQSNKLIRPVDMPVVQHFRISSPHGIEWQRRKLPFLRLNDDSKYDCILPSLLIANSWSVPALLVSRFSAFAVLVPMSTTILLSTITLEIAEGGTTKEGDLTSDREERMIDGDL